MKYLVLFFLLLLVGCAQPPSIGVTITNAPSSLGNCMPEKPTGGCP